MFEKRVIQQSNAYQKQDNKEDQVRNIYYGEVISITDPTEGGRIKVRIDGLDNQIKNTNLVDCFPMLPKFFHIYPKVGEVVRIFIEDTRYPQRSRYWMGSVISQPQKIGLDNKYTALSTTNAGVSAPEEAPSNIPESRGVFPEIEDVALVGRCNADLILRNGEAELRAGKHEPNNILSLNKTNPSSIKLSFDVLTGTSEQIQTVSSNVITADRIALISHDGIPKFRAAEIDASERDRIFSEAHPLGRGDEIVTALELLRKAIVEHIHGYPGLPADKSGILIDLESADFTQILQNNIVIN